MVRLRTLFAGLPAAYNVQLVRPDPSKQGLGRSYTLPQKASILQDERLRMWKRVFLAKSR